MTDSRQISVVVPTLNEAGLLAVTLRELRRQGPLEIVVVDAGSVDSTRQEAAEEADVVLSDGGGLPSQLNRGAQAARGEVLLFWYADSSPPPGGLDSVAALLRDPGVVAGAFSLAFDSNRWIFRLIARGANLRNRLGFGPFGDQGLFVRRAAFDAVGGYRSEAFLPDFELIRRLRARGGFRILPEAARTSVRRWDRVGLLRTLCIHWTVSACYLLGRRRRGRRLETLGRYLRTRR